MDAVVENASIQEDLAGPKPFLTGNVPDDEPLCSSRQGSASSLHSGRPAGSTDSLELHGDSAFFISDHNKLIEEILQNDDELASSESRPWPHSGKMDTQKFVTKRHELEKRKDM